ncbi:MAG: PAS domain S-box protein [Halobacteriota archaeon]|nr:PAS domain S-box protein [Halobacteriota archaeon]
MRKVGDALTESGHEKDAIMDSILELVVYLDTELVTLWANRAACELVGLSSDEVVGLHCYEIWHGQSKPCKDCIMTEVIKTNQPQEGEATGPDGRVWFKRGYPVNDNDGNIIGAVEVTLDITERKRMEGALRESEKKFRLLVDNTQDGIVVVNMKGEFVYSNEAAARNLGYTREEFLKLNIVDIEAIESKEDFEKHYSDVLKGERLRFETVHRKEDGSLIYVDVSLSTCEFNKRVVAYSIWRDITDRKLAEEALRDERNRAQMYLDVAGVILIMINKNEEVTLVNVKGSQILGYKQEDIVGKNWFDNFLPKRMKDEVRSVFQKLTSGEIEPVEYFENPILTRSGEERIVAWHNTVLRDVEGNIIGTLSSGEDITERKKADEALQESEERYKTLVRTSPEAITVSDLKGVITEVSEQTLELHGFGSPEELIGRNAFDLIASEDHERAMENLNKTLEGESARNIEYTLLRGDGSSFIGELNAALVKDAYGRPKEFIAATRDITERKLAEEQLKRSLKEKEVLLREVHHRVKNNLQIISSLIDMSSMRIQDRQAINLLNDARDKIHSLALIHTQLYRSKRFDRIEMAEHIQKLVGYLKTVYTEKKGITTVVEIPDIYLSITQAIPFTLVINELVSNAFKHAFKEGEEGTIEISIQKPAKGIIHARVKDDGIGINSEVDIFKTESLGLKLVRTLVKKQLHGKIHIESKNGTEFTIIFRALDEGGRVCLK